MLALGGTARKQGAAVTGAHAAARQHAVGRQGGVLRQRPIRRQVGPNLPRRRWTLRAAAVVVAHNVQRAVASPRNALAAAARVGTIEPAGGRQGLRASQVAGAGPVGRARRT